MKQFLTNPKWLVAFAITLHDDPPKTFTQEQVAQMVADATKKLSEEFEAIKGKANLTAQEKADLEARLEAVKTERMTEQQRIAHELKKTKDTLDATVKSSTEEVSRWKSRYETSTIHRSITDAAARNDAFAPEQIVALLAGTARLVESTDEDGKPNGEYVTMVKFNDTDAKGKPVVVELTPEEVVKRMTEIPKFQNLFKGKGSGGVGGTGGQGTPKTGLKALSNDPAKYREARKQGQVE